MLPTPGLPSNPVAAWKNTRTAINQKINGVTGDTTTGAQRQANTGQAMRGVVTNYADSVKGLADPMTVTGKDGKPRPVDWKNPVEASAAVLRRAQAAVGAVTGAIGLAQDLMDVGFANLTAPIAAVFPSFPAATMTSLYVGIPHAHSHPPSLIPPAPPIPLPSIGPILLGNSIRVLISGKPAARVGDIGIAPTCGGLTPMFKVFLGSSNVFIGGKRAARVTDLCRVCQQVKIKGPIAAGKAMSAVGKVARTVGKAGKVAGYLGMAADVAEAGVAAQEGNMAMAAAKALNAAMNAAQMAADKAAEAVGEAMGKDRAIPPVLPIPIGFVVVPGSVNVLIGGFPMIHIPNPAEALLAHLSRFKSKAQIDAEAAKAGCPTCG